jgi:hypothetical protein
MASTLSEQQLTADNRAESGAVLEKIADYRLDESASFRFEGCESPNRRHKSDMCHPRVIPT